MKKTLAVLSFCLLYSFTGAADSPLPPPAAHEAASPDKSIVVVTDPASGTQVLVRKSRKKLWSMPGWYRWLFLSNDRVHLVTAYDGMNLIPVNYSGSLVLITFWAKGRRVSEVTLDELFPDKSILQRTVSHFNWGGIEEINSNNELVVKRCDGKVFRYDLSSGKTK